MRTAPGNHRRRNSVARYYCQSAQFAKFAAQFRNRASMMYRGMTFQGRQSPLPWAQYASARGVAVQGGGRETTVLQYKYTITAETETVPHHTHSHGETVSYDLFLHSFVGMFLFASKIMLVG